MVVLFNTLVKNPFGKNTQTILNSILQRRIIFLLIIDVQFYRFMAYIFSKIRKRM